MKLAIALVLLVLVTIIFHLFSPWWFTPLASNWGSIDGTVDITIWITGLVFIAVNLFMAYAVYRYRHNKNRKAHYEPENKPLEVWLTVITSIGVAAMLAPGLVVWAKFIDVPEDAAVVEAVGQQWHWTFRFPGRDGQLGSVDARYITDDNPFGINPKDSFGQDDILVGRNEVHLPLDKPIKVLLRSKDVLHNFAVPQFRVKMDLVPGLVSYLWFTPTKTGSFEILCMELCGLAHHTMRGKVIVDSEEDYQQWLQAQPTFAQSQVAPEVDMVAGQALYTSCRACHGQQGQGNKDLNAPQLAGLDRPYLKRQLLYYRQGIRGSHKEDTYGQQMAPMAAILASEDAMNNVLGYIGSLSPSPAPATVQGDVQKGQFHYQSCSACHGKQGQGNRALNAPRLAGQQDWYIKRQLINFKRGIRGDHPNDLYGDQMIMMAKVLPSEKAVDDLLAYINQL